MFSLRYAGLLILIILISACGFKLRGMHEMPAWLNNIALIAKDGSDKHLVSLLQTELKAYGIHSTEYAAKASYLLFIEKDEYSQQITSVSASTTPRQYQLFYSIQYSLVKANGPVIVESKTVRVSRQLTVNNDRILGSSAEELLINAEMKQDAVRQIVNRLGSVDIWGKETKI